MTILPIDDLGGIIPLSTLQAMRLPMSPHWAGWVILETQRVFPTYGQAKLHALFRESTTVWDKTDT